MKNSCAAWANFFFFLLQQDLAFLFSLFLRVQRAAEWGKWKCSPGGRSNRNYPTWKGYLWYLVISFITSWICHLRCKFLNRCLQAIWSLQLPCDSLSAELKMQICVRQELHPSWSVLKLMAWWRCNVSLKAMKWALATGENYEGESLRDKVESNNSLSFAKRYANSASRLFYWGVTVKCPLCFLLSPLSVWPQCTAVLALSSQPRASATDFDVIS